MLLRAWLLSYTRLVRIALNIAKVASKNNAARRLAVSLAFILNKILTVSPHIFVAGFWHRATIPVTFAAPNRGIWIIDLTARRVVEK